MHALIHTINIPAHVDRQLHMSFRLYHLSLQVECNNHSTHNTSPAMTLFQSTIDKAPFVCSTDNIPTLHPCMLVPQVSVHTLLHAASRQCTIDVCSADQQPSVEEEPQCICQAAAESAEAGSLGEAFQCCPTCRTFADSTCQPGIFLQSAQNKLHQEHNQVCSELVDGLCCCATNVLAAQLCHTAMEASAVHALTKLLYQFNMDQCRTAL